MSSQDRPAKVPIIPLRKQHDPASHRASSARHRRVNRACLSCRAHKIKCSGERPTCNKCKDTGTTCVYVSGRKDRLKTATAHNQDMIALLKELSGSASNGNKTKIEQMLNAVEPDVADTAENVQHLSKGGKEIYRDSKFQPEEIRGEANVSADVGSNEDLDMVDEDLLRNEQSRATGFIGKNSEIQWLRKLHHASDSGSNDVQNEGLYGPPGNSPGAAAERIGAMKRRLKKRTLPFKNTSNLSFYLDDENVEMDFMVNPFELPPFETAEKLLQAYMNSVQNTFPIVAKVIKINNNAIHNKSLTCAQKIFIQQFYHYYASLRRGSPYTLPQDWQVMLNLVFAIGAVYSHLVDADWRADERDHLIYHSRAWALSLKDPWWFSHPDLPRMQISGLLSFYYLAIGHVNSSWVVMGIALRFGYALGLHLRNEDRSASSKSKEMLSRIWWGHYSLERTLSALTGRPSVDAGANCSAPLPLPLPAEEIEDVIIETRFSDQDTARSLREGPLSAESLASSQQWNSEMSESAAEPANSGSFLKHTVKIGEIQQRAMTILYSGSAVVKSWEYVQNMISELIEDLELWFSSLPQGLRFSYQQTSSTPYDQERNILMLYYYSTKILITRPCLCRLDWRIENQTQMSNDFNRRTAIVCVEAAKSINSILPVVKGNIELYQGGPWWIMIHTLMQALAVLLLEVSYDAAHFPHDRQDILPSLKNLLRWLRVLRRNNAMARRAYRIALELIQKLATTIKIDISDLLNEDAAETPGPGQSPSTTLYPDTGEIFFSEAQPGVHQTPAQQSFSQYHHPYQSTRSGYNPPDYASEQVPFEGGSTDGNLFPDLSNDPLPSNTPVSNIFFTDFDEQNPLSGAEEAPQPGDTDYGNLEGRY